MDWYIIIILEVQKVSNYFKILNLFRFGQIGSEVSGRTVWNLSKSAMQQPKMYTCRPKWKVEEQPCQDLLSKVRGSLHGSKVQGKWSWKRQCTNCDQPRWCLLWAISSPHFHCLARKPGRNASKNLSIRALDLRFQNCWPARFKVPQPPGCQLLL